MSSSVVKVRSVVFGVLWMVMASSLFAQVQRNPVQTPSLVQQQLSPSSGREFIPNDGQLLDQHGQPMPEVLYAAESKEVKLYFTATGMHYVFSRLMRSADSSTNRLLPRTFRDPSHDRLTLERMDMEFDGANPNPVIEAFDTSDGYRNYFLNGARITRVRGVRRLVYLDIYPNIDLVIYVSENQPDRPDLKIPVSGMEYDFVVHPGGDPNQIAMHYSGMDSLELRYDGSFAAYAKLGVASEESPRAYQVTDDGKHGIASRFFLDGGNLRFSLGNYDPTRDLTIDPQRLWSTYYGGSGQEYLSDLVVDRANNILICGSTTSTSAIATTGAYQTTMNGPEDAYIAKFRPNGTLIWATYFGGSNIDNAAGIAVDSNDNIAMEGFTSSTSGIATVGAYQVNFAGGSDDDFLAKFDSTGALLWSTYFGGSGYEANEGYHSVASDLWGNFYMVGSTGSTSNIATAGAHQTTNAGGTEDAFVAKFASNGSLRWATYYGGSGTDYGTAVTTDRSGNVILAGYTLSNSGIASAGAYQTSLAGVYDAYVAKFDSNGTWLWGTYYGGTDEDWLFGATSDFANNIYLGGYTSSTNGIATSGAYQTSLAGLDDAFLAKFNSAGAIQWATYYGGAENETLNDICASGSSVYLTGATYSATGIATSDGFQTALSGTSDAYLAQFSSSGSRLWATYYGAADEGFAVAPDRGFNPVFAGQTTSTTNIATTGAYQTTYGGLGDAFLVKFCDVAKPTLTATEDTLCRGTADTISLNASYFSIQWFDSTAHLTSFDNKSSYGLPDSIAPGRHRFSVVVVDDSSCTDESDTLSILVGTGPTISLETDDTICNGGQVHLLLADTHEIPRSYLWSPDSSLCVGCSGWKDPIAAPSVTTTYTIVVTDSNGCTTTGQVTVHVNPLPQIAAKKLFDICGSGSVTIGDTATGGEKPYVYSWTPTTALSASNIATPIASPKTTTVYAVTVMDKLGCTATDTITVKVNPIPHPLIVPDSATLCQSDSTPLAAPPGYVSYTWNTGETTNPIFIRKSGKYFVTVTDTNGCSGVSDTASFIITPPPAPVIAGPSSVCLNSTVLYSIGAMPGNSYVWSVSGGGTITGANSASPSVDWKTTGTWILKIRDITATGCETDTTLTVTVDTKLNPTINPTGPITLCNGDTLILRTSSGFTKYLWSNGATGDSTIVTQSGSYTVTVTGIGGCSGTSAPVVVNVSTTPKPKPVIAASKTSICAGDSVQLSTTQPFASYQWSNGATTPTVEVTQSGSFSVVVGNPDGCTGMSDTVSITVNPAAVATISPSGRVKVCSGDSITLTATAGGAHYLWSDSETSQTIIVKESGTFSVVVTNASGCSATSQSVSVTVNPSPQVTISGPTSICPNTQAAYNVGAQNGITYNWTITGGTIASGQSTNSGLVNWASGSIGTVEITVTDTTSGCSTTASLAVTIDKNLAPVISANGPLSFCIGDSVTLDAGAGYTSYQWQKNGTNVPKATNETLLVGASGAYSVFVTNNGSCSGTSDTVNATVNPIPPIPAIAEVGEILVSTPSSHYQWYRDSTLINGATLDSLTPPSPGYYTVTIFDSNGCSKTSLPFYYSHEDTAITIVAVPPMLTANPGDAVAMPLELISSVNFEASGAMHYIAKIRFNSTLLAPTGTTNGQMQGNDMVVTINGTNPLPLGTTSGTLATLNFLATLGNDSCTDVTIDEFVWTDGPVTVTRQNGAFCLTGVCTAGGTLRLIDPNATLALSQSHPNPATNETEVDYSLAEQGETDLFITDILGREVKHIVSGTQLPGKYTATFNLSDLPQGTYVYILRTPSAIRSRLLQVLR